MSNQWVDIPLAVQESSGLISSWALVNMMLLKSPPESPRPFSLTSVPALAASPITSGAGTMRGMVVHADKLWYVRGTQLYYTANGTSATLVGTVSGTASVRMIGAGTGQIAIVDGAGNQYTATTSAATAFSLPAGVASDVAFMDGYIICPRSGTDEWYISGLDTTTFGALDFSTADAISDTLVGVVACNRDLLLLGKTHTEIWYNAGASPFPFLRGSPGVIERGCASALSARKVNGVVHFIGDDRRAYRLSGYAPEPISTESVQRFLNASTPAGLVASVYSVTDQLLYAVQTTGGSTWEYNTTTGLWHRRQGYDGQRTNFTPGSTTYAYHAGIGPSAVTGVHRVDTSNVDSSLTYSVGSPWFDVGGRRVFEHEFEILGPPGSTGGGTVQLVTSDSDDGLTTVTHASVDLSLQRLAWSRLGSFRRRKHTLNFISPLYNIVIEAARARIEVGL